MASPIGGNAPLCGATNKRTGAPCQNRAMENGKCRMHGGASTGAPGNANAITHGIYSDKIARDELPLWSQIPLGTVDDEIRILKLRLRRTLAEQLRHDANPNDESLLEVKSIDAKAAKRTGGKPGANGQGQSSSSLETVERSTVRVRPDYRALILAFTRRIAELEDRRRVLIAGGEKKILEAGNGFLEALRAINEMRAEPAAAPPAGGELT